MHRKYTIAEFRTLVNKIRARDPLVSISTDYIAGFPTETAADHELSLQVLKDLGFSFLHVFTYSKRNFTAAARLPDVHGATKKMRTKEVIKLSYSLYKEYLQQFLHQKVEVLFEKYENGIYIGKASQYFEVCLKSNQPYDLNEFYTFEVDKIINNTAILKENSPAKNSR